MKKKLFLSLLLVSLVILPALAQRDYSLRAGGYCGYVDAGGLVAPSDDEMNSFTISTTHGYFFNPYFFLGAGVGIESYIQSNVYSIPLYATLRANFVDNWVTPYIDVRLGTAMIPNSYDKAYLYFNPSLGVSIGVSSNLALNISVGYRGILFTNSYYGSEMSNAASIKLGLQF